MLALVQRVKEAKCKVGGEVVAEIGEGILVFIGIEKTDSEENAERIVYRCKNLRIFEDKEGKMNLSVKDIGGSILLIPQFTLCANCNKGLRPSFDNAMKGEEARMLFEKVVKGFKKEIKEVKDGIFGERMEVFLINKGPATFWVKG